MAAATRKSAVEPYDDVAVSLLYETPLEENPWRRFLEFLLQRHRAQAVNLELQRPVPGDKGVDFSAAAWDVSTPHDRYTSQYYASNPFRYEEMVHGRAYLWSDFVDLRSFYTSDFYRSFCAPLGIEHAVCLCIESATLGRRAWLQIARGANRGPFRKAELASLRSLTPHIERVLRLLAKLGGLEHERQAYETTVNALAIGTMVLDQHGRALSSNEQATAVIDANPSLRLREGKLEITDRDENARLQGLIQRQLRKPEPQRMSALSVRASANRKLGLLLRAFPRPVARRTDRYPALIIYVADPQAHQLAPRELISQLFGLSASEARLTALLADGMTLVDAARIMSISLGSARTYSKRIFAKTGVRRQAELVRLVLKSVASLAKPAPDDRLIGATLDE
jgi:DNA-binding CsgD family transcriptional regulator/PAS domain-containing protein